ncbi:hypothetical protein TNCV_162781 [Trichonephila clavipes]|nr:hypothetical protein TNCV_2748171 [Trichonephila clavipes]GFW27433.1 hypothetical protein TNCV_162781 [Trichonephila clavipes]
MGIERNSNIKNWATLRRFKTSLREKLHRVNQLPLNKVNRSATASQRLRRDFGYYDTFWIVNAKDTCTSKTRNETVPAGRRLTKVDDHMPTLQKTYRLCRLCCAKAQEKITRCISTVFNVPL